VTVRFLEVAQQELDEGVEYYNGESTGLGDLFVVEVLSAIDRICRYPNGWHPLSAQFRRCQLRRFPYGLIYRVDDDGILILAVAHLHRRPGYWRERLKQK
jgi:hypothetical protein